MTHHMQQDKQLLEQTLNDAIAVQRFLVEADRRLANECPPDLRPKLEKMAEDDTSHAENLRQVLSTFGWQETEPDDFTSKLIDSSRQVIDSNAPFLKKYGVYNLLKDKAAADAASIATVCYATGDRDCEQLMAVNTTENMLHQITMGGHILDMMAVKARSARGKKAA